MEGLSTAEAARRLASTGPNEAAVVRATVLRDGETREVPSTEIVPGDVVLLSAGDLVPADGRLLASRDLFVNQALLTGEPFPVEKQAEGVTGEGPLSPESQRA